MGNLSDDDDYSHCKGCNENETNINAAFQKNNLEDDYICMNPYNGYIDHNSIKSYSHRLSAALSIEKSKSTNNDGNANDIICQEIVKKRKNYTKQDEYQVQVTTSTEKLQLSLSQEDLTKILSPEPVIETQPQKKSLFRTRSNACIAQNKKTYLKKLNSANI